MLEAEDYSDDREHEHPIDGGNINLAAFVGGGVGDGHSGEIAEADGLVGHGEGSGDHGLGGDDGGDGGEEDHGDLA